MKGIWIEEPIGEEFEYEMREDEVNSELLHKAKALAKQISRRSSMAVIVKWLYNHSKEPHRQTEISEALKLNQGTVSFNLNRLAAVDVVKITRLKGLDSHPLYEVNPTIGRFVTQRYLWLCSFKLLRTLPKMKGEILLDELKASNEFIRLMRKYKLSFEEAVESLRLNRRYVELLYDDRAGKPYAVKWKEILTPLPYKERKPKAIEIGEEIEAEELITEE